MKKYTLTGIVNIDGTNHELDTIEFTDADWESYAIHKKLRVHEHACTSAMSAHQTARFYAIVARGLNRLSGDRVLVGTLENCGMEWVIKPAALQYSVRTIPGGDNPITLLDREVEGGINIGHVLHDLLFFGNGNTIPNYLKLDVFVTEVNGIIAADFGEFERSVNINGNLIIVTCKH